eukprot:CAMPEP_0117663110 /NCGR_PEP_ID=MMETSP0804-20121206/8415_1 /TAXON_ID=1074897 /ORGANISM="Tetraselmis astigmatica, Strain CCMP880" /LENGTH=234 /DNA_ID=CAMNT_0005470061 /DNA_START=126 /DNA_END=830 /DNA_ORIENTATION=+
MSITPESEALKLLGVEAEETKSSPPLLERAPDRRSSLEGRSDLALEGLATEPDRDRRVRDLFGGDIEEEDEGGDLAEGKEGGGGKEDGCATSWSDDATAHTPARKTIGRPKGSKKTTTPPKVKPAKKQKTCLAGGEMEHLIMLMNDVKVKSRILGTAEKNEGVYEDVTKGLNDKFPSDAPKSRQQVKDKYENMRRVASKFNQLLQRENSTHGGSGNSRDKVDALQKPRWFGALR